MNSLRLLLCVWMAFATALQGAPPADTAISQAATKATTDALDTRLDAAEGRLDAVEGTVEGLPSWNAVPATPYATGTPGQIAWEAGWMYVCTNLNSWERAPLSDWAPPSFIGTLTKLAWLDASVAGSVRDATDTGAAADGAPSSKWIAQVGVSPTQTSSGLRPTWDADGLNGHPAVRFSGTQLYDWASTFNHTTTSGYTIYIVCDLNTAVAAGRVLCLSGTAPQGFTAYDYTTSNVIGTYGGGFLSGNKPMTGNGMVVAAFSRSAAGSGAFYVNAEAAGTFANSEGSPAGSIGGYNNAGSALQGITGTIGEILIVQGNQSAADVFSVTSELTTKWKSASMPEQLVFLASGQSNATADWAAGIEAELKVRYGHSRVTVAWVQHGGCPMYYWYHDGAPELLYTTGSPIWEPSSQTISIPGRLRSAMGAALAAGKYPVFKGFFWFQGESDAVDANTRASWTSFPGDPGPNQWLYYKDRFNGMMWKLRSDFRFQHIPTFCLCLPSYSAGVSGGSAGVVPADLDLVRAVQVVLGSQANGIYIDPLLVPGASKQDKVHWNFSNGSEQLIGAAAAQAWFTKFGAN